MATFLIGDKTYRSGPVPLSLGCEAEKMLKVSLSDGGFALTAIQLYVAIRQTEPTLEPFIVADTVMSADFLTLYGSDEEETATPLDGNGDGPAARTEATDPATTGLRGSAS